MVMLYVFYDSFIPAPLLLPVWLIYMKDWMDDLSRKKEQELRQQFRDSIQSMSAALKAGYSVENAIREAGRDISPVYPEETRIRTEFKRMERQMDMNMAHVSTITKMPLQPMMHYMMLLSLAE